ncbi:MAG: hypothetical protein AAGJ88_16845 [Pseudomonadota bacterium]
MGTAAVTFIVIGMCASAQILIITAIDGSTTVIYEKVEDVSGNR